MTAAPKTRLCVRADDAGLCPSVNAGTLDAVARGLVRSVEILAVAPWFHHAAAGLAGLGADVGVHLALTSEWDGCRWRPLTAGRSFTEPDGTMHRTVVPWPDRPGVRCLRECKANLREVEAELRAQIELVRTVLGGQVTHLSRHMYGPTCRPDWLAIVRRLAAEYRLPLDLDDGTWHPHFAGPAWLEALPPGAHRVICHVSRPGPDVAALGCPGNTCVEAFRGDSLRAVTNAEALAIVERRGIELVSCGELFAERARRAP